MPSSNRGGHPYQRFIPREEVQAVAAWAFEPVGDAERQAAQKAQDDPPIDAEQLEAVRAKAFAEGFEQGRERGAHEAHEALKAPMKRQAEDLSRRFAELMGAAQAELDTVRHQLADQMLLLACDIARQVVRRELAQPLEPVRAVVDEALSLLTDDARPAVLKLHPKDAERLGPTLTESLQAQKVRLVPDARLTQGGCVLETTQGSIDATVERRWARAVGNLGLDAPWSGEEHADE